MTASPKGRGLGGTLIGGVITLLVILSVSACASGTAVENPASQPNAPEIRFMQMLSPSQGWVLTTDRLIWTSDGGANWSDITPPQAARSIVKGAFFVNPQEGWLVASGDQDPTGATQITGFHTEDGGATWESVDIGEPDNDYTSSLSGQAYIHFIDPQHGWVVVKLASSSNFSVGDLFRTTDGGVTWTKLSIPIGDPIRFVTPSDGWTAGGAPGDELYVTRDGGTSWERQTVSSPPIFRSSDPLYDLPFFDGPRGILAVSFSGNPSGVAVFSSGDGGRSWKLTRSVQSPSSVEIDMPIPSDVVGSETWIAAASDGSRIFATSDAGKSLQEIAPNGFPTGGVADLDFSTAKDGWAWGNFGECPPGLKTGCVVIGRLFKTTDGGQTWEKVDLPASADSSEAGD
jgi:photosystem II stability/assembly factor-like uncharacterized protein